MNNLITISGEQLQLPAPRSDGVAKLYERIERLPNFLQGDVGPKRFVAAVAAEANRLPPTTDPGSIVAAAFNCAYVGLVPGQTLGHAHFIPYEIKKSGRYLCQLIFGFRGFLELAYGSGFLKTCMPEVVLRGEQFKRWNDETGAKLTHELGINRELVWTNVQAAYCIWTSTTGGGNIGLVQRDELEKLYRRGNVWRSEPIAMCRKTAIRREAKLWKITGRMANAVYLDEIAERDEPQPLLIDVEPTDDPPPSLAEFGRPAAAEEPPVSPKLFEGFRQKLATAANKQETWAEIQDDPAFELFTEDQAAELRGMMGA